MSLELFHNSQKGRLTPFFLKLVLLDQYYQYLDDQKQHLIYYGIKIYLFLLQVKWASLQAGEDSAKVGSYLVYCNM